jgi:HAD superfamily hydrolase (TIGR01490 family)
MVLIITATNSFVTGPIAAAFGVKHLIATVPEMREGRFTGEIEGVPCFREGKVQRLQQWLDKHDMDLNDSTFYSDSHNDLPLLEQVSNPVAVDADDTLVETARARNWPITSFR